MAIPETESPLFFTFHIAKHLGVSSRKVISMIECGYFDASIKPANGHPSKRVYNISDLLKAHFALQLEKMGYTVEFIRNKLNANT